MCSRKDRLVRMMQGRDASPFLGSVQCSWNWGARARINRTRSQLLFHGFFLSPDSRWNLCNNRCARGAKRIPTTVMKTSPQNKA